MVSGSGVGYTSVNRNGLEGTPSGGQWLLLLLQPALAALTASRWGGRAPHLPSRALAVCIWAITERERVLVGGRGLENVYVCVSLSFSLCSCLNGLARTLAILSLLFSPLTGPIF